MLDDRHLATCGKCNACRHACPVHAITVTVTGVQVDRDACFDVITRRGGECFDCMLACKHNILKLRCFERGDSGTWETCTR